MASRPDDDQHRHLSGDVLFYILTRLPVKSLLRFKCVCKNWYDLIQNPSFARAHLRIQKLQNKGRMFLGYGSFHKDTSEYRCRYALCPDETLASDAYHDLDFIETRCLAVIAGPVNGLFCLFNDADGLIIWNPAIREFRTLPFAHHSDCTPKIGCSRIGFGIDNSTDYYKVVLIRTVPLVGDVCVHVYSPRTNTWRHLNSLDYLLPEYFRDCSETGAYSKGVYYWWAGSGVLAFDMGNEVFRVISAPFILPSNPSEVKFHVCGNPYNDDCIALYQFKDVPESELLTCFEIWVMEAKGCWIKLFSVGTIPRIDFKLGFWKNGELLFFKRIQDFEGRYIFQLVLYNPFTQEHRYLGPKANWFGYQALVYHESVVSLN